MENKLVFNYSGVQNDKYVLLIHGLGSSSDVWEKSKNYLEKAYTVIQVDLYGHIKNDSIPKEIISIQKTAEDIINELSNKGIDKIDIIGHSLGGVIAVDIAVKQSGLVGRLVLVDTPSKQTGLKLTNYLFLELIKKDYETVIKEHYKKMTANEVLYEYLIEIALKTDKYTYYQYMKSLFESDYSSFLEKVDKDKVYLLFSQVLVSKENNLDKALKKYGYNTIRKENIYYFKGAGHFIMNEKEKEFIDLLSDIFM